jgi:superfamily II DNA/RNA helicase
VSTEQTNTPPSFTDFGFSEPILRAVLEQGYTTPTPIQAQAMPHVLNGQDVMGAAQTGTGKTAAFVLPILQNILPMASSSASPARHPIRALVLTPTRELADQVADNAFKYAKYTDIRTAVVFGGVDMSAQTSLLRSGVELLIATPGRLLDHIGQKNANLSQVQFLILDEADRMLDMGFLPDLQRIIGLIPAKRQTLLFSATFSSEIKKLAQSYLRDPVTIEVARQNAAADTVRQVIHMVPSEQKKDAVIKVLKARIQQGLTRQAIVFTNSRIGCGKLASALERSGIKAGAIHGDKSQIERMQILESFKKGTMDVLVATDCPMETVFPPVMVTPVPAVMVVCLLLNKFQSVEVKYPLVLVVAAVREIVLPTLESGSEKLNGFSQSPRQASDTNSGETTSSLRSFRIRKWFSYTLR